jgi:hypothetical protein
VGESSHTAPTVLTTTLRIVSNDPDEGTISLTVHCTHLPRPEPDIELQFEDGTPLGHDQVIDLGTVPSPSQQHAYFKIANTGNDSLILTNLTMTGYDCTVYIPPVPQVEPGESLVLLVSCYFDGRLSVPRTFDVTFNIFSNDNDGSSFTLRYTELPIRQVAAVDAATATPGANRNGWNNTDVTVSYTCTGKGSGVDLGRSLGNDVLTASSAATERASTTPATRRTRPIRR